MDYQKILRGLRQRAFSYDGKEEKFDRVIRKVKTRAVKQEENRPLTSREIEAKDRAYQQNYFRYL